MSPPAVARVGAWLLVGAVGASVALGCADRRSPAPPPPTPPLVAPTPHRYDPTTVETITGEIARIDRVAETRGVHAVVAVDGGGSLSVRLGAAWYLDEQGLTLARGDAITVTGSRVMRDGAPALIAREVTVGERRVVLRTAGGVPAWSAARRRGEVPPGPP